MATVVCQGLQSSLESQLGEKRALRLTLSSPKLHFSQSLELALKLSSLSDSNAKERIERSDHDEDKYTSSTSVQYPDVGGWSFLQILTNTSKEPIEKENVYVHPLIKRYPTTLSEKSLELCTESLGSETGTIDVIDNNMFSSSLSPSVTGSVKGNSPANEHQQPRQSLEAKKRNCTRSFPPPLTTMRGSESIQFSPHREDGRLTIKAVRCPSRRSYFQAERSEGHLRLSFIKNPASDLDFNEENETMNIAKNDEQEIEDDAMNSDEEEGREEEGQEEGGAEEEREQKDEKEMEGKDSDVGAEMGMEYQSGRRRRCKEGEAENNGLLTRELLAVAAS